MAAGAESIASGAWSMYWDGFVIPVLGEGWRGRFLSPGRMEILYTYEVKDYEDTRDAAYGSAVFSHIF